VKSILDPTFKYKNSAETDLRATFARVRREQAAAKLQTAVEQAVKVTPIAKAIKGAR
jgi:hypothetical protein